MSISSVCFFFSLLFRELGGVRPPFELAFLERLSTVGHGDGEICTIVWCILKCNFCNFQSWYDDDSHAAMLVLVFLLAGTHEDNCSSIQQPHFRCVLKVRMAASLTALCMTVLQLSWMESRPPDAVRSRNPKASTQPLFLLYPGHQTLESYIVWYWSCYQRTNWIGMTWYQDQAGTWKLKNRSNTSTKLAWTC